jgi:hypothetical protein
MRRKKFSVMLEGTSPDVPRIFGSAGALPSRKSPAIRHSPFIIHQSPVANRYSLPFGSVGASPSQFIPSLVPRPRFKSVATKTKPAKAG